MEAPCTPIEVNLGEQLYHQRAEREKSADQIEHRGVVADDVASVIIGGVSSSRVVPPEVKRYHGDDSENC